MEIKWGIIGCGDVTEVKSGPAFNKVPNSSLVAVMRRNPAKAEDYAKRHNVPKWYSNANDLINDPEVNAIYIATPPLQHEEYTIAALQAGKPVYVEKPMTLTAPSAQRMQEAAVAAKGKLAVAHYRRAQPMFVKLKDLLDAGTIGEVRFANLQFFQPLLTQTQLQDERQQWRVDPSIAGGGLFHDLAPHQLDLMLYFFGQVKNASGFAANQGKLYPADDIVTGHIQFESGVIFNGLWCFSTPEGESKDLCEIIGSEGKISCSVFGEPQIYLTKKGRTSTVHFEKLEHVQQPMIEKVVQYFLGEAKNPSSAENGVEVMRLVDVFSRK